MADESKSSTERPSFWVDGLCSAPFTAFHEDGTLDLDGGVAAQLQILIDQKIRWAFVGGTTGESYKLTHSERKSLLERWDALIKEKGADVSLIAHVGCETLRDTIELATHAAGLGVKAIGVMPPVFFKPKNLAAVVDWLKAVAASVPTTAVYWYHIKFMTGCPVRVDKLLEACAEQIPNVVGAKFSDTDLIEFSTAKRVCGGRFNMLFGKDAQLLGALAMGADGAVGSTYNFMAPEHRRMIAAFKKGDLETARKHAANAGNLNNLKFNASKYGTNVNVQKAVMELKGVRVGPPRTPHRRPTKEGMKLLKADLEAMGFFEWSV